MITQHRIALDIQPDPPAQPESVAATVRNTPLGFFRDREPNQNELAQIELVLAFREAGATLGQICRLMSSMGKLLRGRPWTRQAAHSVVKKFG